MEKMKRVLALLLVFAMLMPNLTTIALAADTEDFSVISTEPFMVAEETEAFEEAVELPTEQTEAPAEETEASEEETETPVAETEVSTEETEAEVMQETITVEETVTDSAASELAEEELAVETLTVEETVAPDSGYSNDDMFAMYVNQVLYPDKPSTLGTGGYDNLDNPALRGLYTYLKEQAATIASIGGDTTFTLATEKLADLGFTTNFTAETLGIQGKQNVTEAELKALVAQHFSFDLGLVVRALLVDCPYVLYWYDKTIGSHMEYTYGYRYYPTTGEIVDVTIKNMVIKMDVAKAYQGSSDLNVASNAAAAAASTAAKAEEIRDTYENLSDLEKLTAYKDYICGQVIYNDKAASKEYTGGYGDPWQLIYVFDEDDTTNVVCEGYSKAFQYLCDLSDFQGKVESYLVSGYADGPHMWNIVSIEGRNYMVDVTNTDPSEKVNTYTFGEDGAVFLTGAEGNIEDGYIFTNTHGDTLHYLYGYYDDEEEWQQPAIDAYDDKILILSDISYTEYLKQLEEEENRQQEQAALLERLANDAVLSEEVTITAPEPVTFNNLTVAEGGKLTIQGATVTISGESFVRGGMIELADGTELIVQGNLYLDGRYDEDADETHIGTLQLNEGTKLTINGEHRENTEGKIHIQANGALVNQGGTVDVPHSTISLVYGEGAQTDVPADALYLEAYIADESMLEAVAADLHTMHDGNPWLNYGGACIHIDHDLILNKNITIYGGVELILENQNPGEDDCVTLTVAEAGSLTLQGCAATVSGGTGICVDGEALLSNAQVVVSEGGRLFCRDTGTVKVLNNGELVNRGEIYVSGQLITEEEGSQPGWVCEKDPVYTESYISLRWLENRGNGWYEDQDSHLAREIRIAPGEQFFMIAYLNQWNDDQMDWEVTPIHANKLVTDEKLVLEPFSVIQDGSNHTEDDQNISCFFRISSAEDVLTEAVVETFLAYSNTGIQAKVELGCNAGGFYSENPTAAGKTPSELWLNNFEVNGNAKTFWFWYDPSQDFETGWTVDSLTMTADRNIGADVQANKVADNLYTVTIAEETVQNIYALRDFWLHAEYTLVRDGHDPRQQGADINCRAVEFGQSEATFFIDGQWYHASRSYDGFFTTVITEDGDEYSVPVEVSGVSYDIEKNMLTLNGAKLHILRVTNHWRDDYSGHEDWNLPNGQLILNLIGENSISAENKHALMVNGDIHLIITGNGSLNVSTTGDENNTCPSAIAASESNITIENEAKVNVSVSGVAYNPDEGRWISMTPIRGVNGSERCLLLRENAELTTSVPANVCTNGYFDENGNFVEEGGFVGIDFPRIEINDNAKLDTQTIGVWDAGRGNAYGGYRQNGGTVTITGLPYYDSRYVPQETGVAGHYHFSGIEADYGQIDINGGELNIHMNATEAQKAKSVYYHALQSRGGRIELNGGVVNVTGNFSGTGIKVGEDDWDGGANAVVNFNGTELNMTDSKLYGRAIDVAPNGSIYFNGGLINAYRAGIEVRGAMEWNGTQLQAEECGVYTVQGGQSDIKGGWLHIKNGSFEVCNAYDEKGNITQKSGLNMFGGYVELDNSFAYVDGDMNMSGGAVEQTMDYRKLTTSANVVRAFVIDRNGVLELSKEAYLQIVGIGETDGISNDGIFRMRGGSVSVDTEDTVYGTFGLRGSGTNDFEKGYLYLDGYTGLAQFNSGEESKLHVGGEMTVDIFGSGAGIVLYAPAEFTGGIVNAYAAELKSAAGEAGKLPTRAVVVENNDDGTNASLNITGGNHYFGSVTNEDFASCGQGLVILNAPVAFTGGAVVIDAEMAVHRVAEDPEKSFFRVPVIVNRENGEILELKETDAGVYTLLSGESYVGKVGFLLSQDCGDTENDQVQWRMEANETGNTLIISGTGNMADYHMPANDPASWRVAPWYAARETITRVVVEEGVTGIGDWAFGRLPKVTEIVYPATVTQMDLTSSYDCPELVKFTIAEGNQVYSVANPIVGEPNSGEVIIENGSLVLAAIRKIKSYKADAEIHTIGMGAFDSTELETLDLSASQLTEIFNMAFADCHNLKEVILPEGVTTIGLAAFQNSGLEKVTIPATMAKIRNYAFDGCSALADVVFNGSESQWNAISIGSGNNALISVPVIFESASAEEKEGEAYLSYRKLTFGDRGYYEELGEPKTEMTIPVGFYQTLVVYCNVWNEETQKWDRRVVDPEKLYGDDLEIGAFRYYEGIGIEEGEPNADNFFEMAFHSGWGEDKDLCYKLDDGTVAKLTVSLSRSQVGFYSADPTDPNTDRNAIWLNYYPINPNISGHSAYFALTEHPSEFESVQVDSDRLTAEDLEKVRLAVEKINGSVYKITMPDDVAAKVYDYRGIPLQVSYKIAAYQDMPAEEGTVEFNFGSVSFEGPCVSFGINGVWYEAYEGLDGYFRWDEETETRLAYRELPGGVTYDYESDTLTMENSSIESLHLQYRWHDDRTGESGTHLQDQQLTLNLVGNNTISNPGSESALYVGGGLELTITGSGSLNISATNANATEDNYSQNAVTVDDGATLIIADNAKVTTSIERNEKMTNGWLMNLWGGGNNTLIIKDYATLTTTLPDGARDNYEHEEGFKGGYKGIDWFGEIRVQDHATLDTSTLTLSEYYDENDNYRGKGSYVQTGGTVTIKALGFKNQSQHYGYAGLRMEGDNSVEISGGTLTVMADAANVAADKLANAYAGFSGIRASAHFEISGKDTLVEIQVPHNGTGLEVTNTTAFIRDGATVKVVGNGQDVYAVNVNMNSRLQLHGGKVDVTDASVRVMNGGNLEIHDGTLSVVAKDHPGKTCLETLDQSRFVLHEGTVLVDNGLTANAPDAVSVGGHMELNGGTMTVSGTNGLAVHENGNLEQKGATLNVTGLATAITCHGHGEIVLFDGSTNAVLGKQGAVINTWSSAVSIYEGGLLDIHDGHHTFRVDGTPGQDADGASVWLSAMDVSGNVNFFGGTVELDAGVGGQAIFNRNTGDYATVAFHNGLGAVSAVNGTRLDMYSHGNNGGEYYYALGAAENAGVSSAVIMETSAGNNSSWNIEKRGDETVLIISGNQDMYNYYMPENDPDWNQTPWYSFKDQITHVEVEEGINHIGDWVFARMSNLVNVKLPGSVNHISTSAFYGCDKLESFTMQGNDNYRLDENTCGETDAQGYRTGSVIIEGGWKVLTAAPASDMRAYSVPHYISEIGNGAFQNCTGLTELIFDADNDGNRNIWNIGNNAFEKSGLTRIELPEGITAIGRSAFDGCGAVTEIALPASVNAIRPYAFSGCGDEETTVTFAGSESQWNQISKGDGNAVLNKVVFLDESVAGGDDYLSFRWLEMDENRWQENSGKPVADLSMPADFTFYGVFYYNHWDEENEKWTVQAVIPEAADESVQITPIDEAMLKEYNWEIDDTEENGEFFVLLTTAPDTWDSGETNNGFVHYKQGETVLATMDIAIQRNSYGFYSGTTPSDDTWLNYYEMNSLKASGNEFYFIFEGDENWKMDGNSFRLWNDNGAPNSSFKTYAYSEGIFKIVLDPVFLQDAWRYGDGIKLRVGFDVVNGSQREYREAELQLRAMDLGNPDAIFEIDDQEYLYFKEQKAWMTYGDPANNWRPGVVNIPAGVSYDAEKYILTLKNVKLNNLSLHHTVLDDEGNAKQYLPVHDLTLNLIGNNVIESGHREALIISGDLNVTVTGTGTLRLHSHNDPGNQNEHGQYAFDAVVVEHNSKLIIDGGTVNAEITGEGYRNGQPAMLAALRGQDARLVIKGGSLTTAVPDNARDNGPYEADFEPYFSTHAISQFRSITVEGGTLNTQSLYIADGEIYTQSGGTVNIEGMGHLSVQHDDRSGRTWNNYHYNGLQLNHGAKAYISGGQLNLDVTPEGWEHGSGSYYNGLSVAGGYAEISDDAKIHVHGAFEGNAISVGHDYDDHGNRNGYGTLEMTGGTLTVFNEIGYSQMHGIEVNENCRATITGGILNLIPAKTDNGEPSYAGINNMGYLTIGGNAVVHLNQAVCSSMMQNEPSQVGLTINGNAQIFVEHDAEGDKYAWDIVPGSRFNFESGTITATNAAFCIGGRMDIGANATLNLTDSDFNADGLINLDGSLTMKQNKVVDNKFIGPRTDEWGNTWDEYEYQSRLYVTGTLNLNSGKLNLTNVAVNLDGHSVVNQTGTIVTINNQAADMEERKADGHEGNDWLASVNVNDGATLNIDGGSIVIAESDLDGGLNVRGTMNMRNGTLDVVVPDGIAVAARGQVTVSGGEMKLVGWVGYEQADEEGFEHGKLTVTGGTLDIDARNTGIDLYNNMVVTGGDIDIDISGDRRQYTDDKGVPMDVLAGCGIMAYNDSRKISVSINGGTLNIDVPDVTVAEGNAISSYGILGSQNSTIRINGGDIGIRAKAALFAEPGHIVVNNRMHVLSMNSGNTLDLAVNAHNSENEKPEADTYAENGIFVSAFNNFMMDGYATNLKIVSKTAGRNTVWDMDNGTLSFTASGAGELDTSAIWYQLRDKVTRLELGLGVAHTEQLCALFENLASVKAPHNSDAQTYADANEQITFEPVHELEMKENGVEGCKFCVYSSVQSIVESNMSTNAKVEAIQQIETEELKAEMQQEGSNVVEHLSDLEEELLDNESELTVAVESNTQTVDAQDVEITGAALNATEDTAKVALIIADANTKPEFDEEQYASAVRFSMDLQTTSTTGTTSNLTDLHVPVQITIPLPKNMDVNRLEILHYHDVENPEKVPFTYEIRNDETTYISFVLSGFSDIELLEQQRTLQLKLVDKSIAFGEEPNLDYVFYENGAAIETPENYTVETMVRSNKSVLNPGIYTTTAIVTQPEGDNTIIEVMDGKLTVGKKIYTVTMADQSMTYGEDLPVLTYSVSDTLPAGVVITPYVEGIANAAAITRAGEYVITTKQPVETDAYLVNIVPGTLTVQKQKLVITFTENQKTTVNSDFKPVYIVTADGQELKDMDLQIVTSGYNLSKAGEYTLKAYLTDNDRYELEKVVPGTLMVTQNVTVTILPADMKLGGEMPEFAYTVEPKIEDLTVTRKILKDGVEVQEITEVGEYTVTAVVDAPAYYDVKVEDGTLTVTQDVKVTIHDVEMPLGSELPEFTYTVTEPAGLKLDSTKLNFWIKDSAGNKVETIIAAGEYTITATPVAEDSFYNITVVDGKLTVVESIIHMKIKSSNIVLGNELAMYFYISNTDLAGEDYVAVVRKTYADGREDVVEEIPYAEWEDTSNNRKRFKFNGIAAKEMGDNLVVVIKNNDGTVLSEEYTDSIQKYIERGFETGNAQKDVELATMLVDMLNYGAAAQGIFQYDENHPVNGNMGAYQNYATKSVALNNNQVKGNGFRSMSLVLESNISMIMFFEKAHVTKDMTAVVTFTDHYGKAHRIEVAGSDFEDRGTKGWAIIINELVVADGCQLVTCEFKDADGNTVDGVYGIDSMESMCARAVAGGGGSYYEDIMKFSIAAHNYFH